MLIVFEGTDRSGKTTQSKLLHTKLLQTGLQSHLHHHPNRQSLTGPPIDLHLRRQAIIPSMAVSLLLSANLWSMSDQLDNHVNIVDRYIWTNIAYSALRQFPISQMKTIMHGLPSIDLLFYLRADPQVRRDGWGEEVYDEVEFQRGVGRVMDGLAEEGYGVGEGGEVVTLDATLSIEELHALIWAKVTTSIKNSMY